ncbi:MAG TPA: hypothetical protein VNT01_18010 [Symbiobacteriaceae bacterium]|nr:hypothetical protein [Symbiobacteriaceae bacterium]
MIWVILLLGAAGIAWFLLAPRRLSTLENTPAVIDKRLKADSLIETTEDPREVRPIAQKAAHRSGDTPVGAEKPVSKAQRNPQPPS